MADSLHILLLEDSPFDAELVELELLQSGIVSDCSRVTSCAAFCAEPLDDYDVILADYTLPDGTAADALEVVQRRGLDTPFIVITGTIGEERAVELIKLGVTDYLLKDRLERLGTAISRALMNSGCIVPKWPPKNHCVRRWSMRGRTATDSTAFFS